MASTPSRRVGDQLPPRGEAFHIRPGVGTADVVREVTYLAPPQSLCYQVVLWYEAFYER
jgi:hypothetical protein